MIPLPGAAGGRGADRRPHGSGLAGAANRSVGSGVLSNHSQSMSWKQTSLSLGCYQDYILNVF